MKFFVRIYVLALLGLASSCVRPDSDVPQITSETNRIFVSQQEVLFFYNVRSLYYQIVDDDNTHIKNLTLKDYDRENNLEIGIKHAYDREEAYLFFVNSTIQNESGKLTIKWIDAKNKMSGNLIHTIGHPIQDYIFIKKLMRYHQLGVELQLNNKNLFTEKSFKSFQTVFKDYTKFISMK